jgi:hypothetical protein
MRSTHASGKRDVAQLREKAKESVSQLKVLPNQDPLELVVFASEAGLSVTQLLSEKCSL